jgi:hypothetical protein
MDAIKETAFRLTQAGKRKVKNVTVDPKANDLRAFRTIIGMLSLINNPNGRLSSSNDTAKMGGKNSNDRKKLRVLDALSTVLIRQHEITAVVVSESPMSEHLQVFASVVNLSNALPSIQPGSNSKKQGLLSRFRNNFTVSVNRRSEPIYGNIDSLMNKNSYPTITNCDDVQVPSDLVAAAGLEGVGSMPLLALYLEKYWRVLSDSPVLSLIPCTQG